MIRYLPILMVALGLLLVSTSFAAAQTSDPLRPAAQEVCDAAIELEADGQKLGRCWKQIGLGILINGCKVHAALVQDEDTERPLPSPCWPSLADPVGYEGPSPPLDLPPPKA